MNEGHELRDLTFDHEELREEHFVDCLFVDCEFTYVSFDICLFQDCVFENCTFLNPTFSYSTMQGLTVRDSAFIGTSWGDIQSKIEGFQVFARVERCVFKFNDFFRLNLSEVDFSSSFFNESNFERCNLSKSNFSGADLGKTRFELCNLEESDFTDAQDYLIDTRNCRMKGAKFSFPEAITLLDMFEIEIG